MNPQLAQKPCVRCGAPTSAELHRAQNGRCPACFQEALSHPRPTSPTSPTRPTQKRRTFFRAYSAEEVVDGWRLFNLGDGGRVGPKGYDRSGRSHLPNRTLLMYAHVEQFLDGRGDLVRALLKDQLTPTFEEWFKENPFQIVPQSDDLSVRDVEELKPRPLIEACELRKISPNRVREALRRTRLAIAAGLPTPPAPNVWKPQGSPQMTTLAELDKWLAVVKHGGKRV